MKERHRENQDVRTLTSVLARELSPEEVARVTGSGVIPPPEDGGCSDPSTNNPCDEK